MSRYRLYPDEKQEAALLRYCSDARFVWNLGLEQRLMYRPQRGPTPNYHEQSRQLTELRKAEPWLAEGLFVVQQQALRDLDIAWRKFFAGTHGRPKWRKAGRREGFRITDYRSHRHLRRLNRHWGQVKIQKLGWVRFRWSRAVPDAKSFRVTRDSSGRWHLCFAVAPLVVDGPGTGSVAGIDLGVAVSATLSNGEAHACPQPSPRTQLLRRRLGRAKAGSGRRLRARVAYARSAARDKERRKDWAQKLSSDLARRFDVIRVEDLNIRGMTRSPAGTVERPGKNIRQKAGVNRRIRASGWGLLVARIESKAPGRVQRVKPNFTSQRCSACGHTSAENRKSQAVFACVACGFTCNADVNAAINIAAGHAVKARGGDRVAGPVKREPQLAA